MKSISILAPFLFLIAWGQNGHAAEWKADKVHSRVNFTVTHMIVAEVTGMFRDFEVVVTATDDEFSDARFEATIKTGSIFTDNEKRDAHLRSDDFFNAEQYPDMTFVSTSIEKTGEGHFLIRGDLTIRDITKPVILEAEFRGTVRDPWGTTRAGFKATTTINRFEYGLQWDASLETGALIVGENVDVTLFMQLVKE